MSVEDILKEHGFNFSASCGGKACYTKWVKHNGKRAYVTVNDATGDGFPATLEEPVKITVHDLKSGNELEPPREISSLRSIWRR